jgi:hypothetical protein
MNKGTKITHAVRAGWRAAVLVMIGSGMLLEGRIIAAPDNARQIVDDVDRRSTSKSQRYEGVLQSFDDKGKTSEKRWVSERIGSHGDSKVIIRFTEPAEVRGVALLVVNHPDRASDQWMWTPAIERDRRIALQDRSTRFFGTDFSFEDLEERDANQYDYKMLPEKPLNGVPCFLIQSTPKESKSSQYTRSTLWVRKDMMAVARIESYIKDALVRRLDYSDFQNISGIWTARELKMADLRRATATWLNLQKIEYNLPMADTKFTVQALRTQ